MSLVSIIGLPIFTAWRRPQNCRCLPAAIGRRLGGLLHRCSMGEDHLVTTRLDLARTKSNYSYICFDGFILPQIIIIVTSQCGGYGLKEVYDVGIIILRKPPH